MARICTAMATGIGRKLTSPLTITIPYVLEEKRRQVVAWELIVPSCIVTSCQGSAESLCKYKYNTYLSSIQRKGVYNILSTGGSSSGPVQTLQFGFYLYTQNKFLLVPFFIYLFHKQINNVPYYHLVVFHNTTCFVPYSTCLFHTFFEISPVPKISQIFCKKKMPQKKTNFFCVCGMELTS